MHKGFHFIRLVVVGSVLLTALTLHAQDLTWPQFRGPNASPVSTNAKLVDRWSKTENVEWSAEIPGRGWSSPIVAGDKIFLTTVLTEGKSKPPQIGTEYSSEYVAELQKQGLPMNKIIEKVNERDIEMPNEVKLHYVLYCLKLKSGKVEWQCEFYAGQPPSGTPAPCWLALQASRWDAVSVSFAPGKKWPGYHRASRRDSCGKSFS
jgi:hypothetical protein